MKHILHPTDFSDHAANALKLSNDLLLLPKTRLTILHVIEWPPHEKMHDAAALEKNQIEMTDEAEKKLDHYIKNIFNNSLPIPNPQKKIVFSSSIYKGILDTIESLDPYMVLMGQKGKSNLKGLLVGPNTQHVLEHAKCNMVIVP